jgi:hypothetical protein
MTRRCWLLSAAALPLRADAAQEAWDALAAAASALGLGNASVFLAAFDQAIPGFADLRANVDGLLSAWNVQSSIDLVESSGTEEKPALELDWLLQLAMRSDAARAVRSRQRVKCRFGKQGRRWKIVEFTPLGMFAPPAAARANGRSLRGPEHTPHPGF